MSNLQMRVITAIFLIAISLVATRVGGVAFCIFILIVGAAVYHEWQMITLPRQTAWGRGVGWLLYGLVAILLLTGQSERMVFIVVLIAAIALGFLGWRNGNWWAGGFLYAVSMPVILVFINRSLGFEIILYLYAVVWATDSAAYFAGRAIGGPKLAPKISPNKTWSGAIGGTLAGICGGFLLILLDPKVQDVWGFILALSLALSIASQIGDLGESWLKRHFNIKDSGTLLPGHGGVMDRVDGLIAGSITLYPIIYISLVFIFR